MEAAEAYDQSGEREIYAGPLQKRVVSDDFSKWQLETDQLLEEIYNSLLGKRKERGENGRVTWSDDKDSPATLTVLGANTVISNLRGVLSKHVFLSNIGEDMINSFTIRIVGSIGNILVTDIKRFGLVDAQGEYDHSKLDHVYNIVEPAVYAALCRGNDFHSFDTLNEAHQVHEAKFIGERNRGGFKMPFFGSQGEQ